MTERRLPHLPSGRRPGPPGAILLLPVVFAFTTIDRTPAAAAESWRSFLPRSLKNGAFVEGFGSRERDERRSGSHTRWADMFFKQKLTLFSIGYSYHPRFLRYRLSVAGAGKQEWYDSTALDNPSWNYDSGLEYDANVTLLPEHPYNAELYARRLEPVYKEQSATHHDGVEESYGASLRYRGKPYFAHAGYDDSSIDSGESDSHVRRAAVGGQYFNRFTSGRELSFNAAFNPSWFDNSAGIDGASMEYHGGGLLDLDLVRLHSSVSRNTVDQESRSQEFDSDQLAFYELLTMRLPWRFRADASYRQQESDAKIRERHGGETREFDDDAKEIRIDLVHRLYESVDTSYVFVQDWHDSSGADTTARSHSLTVHHTKTIPWRSRVLTGAAFSRADTDSEGKGTDIVSEPYPAVAVPGSFELRQQNVDAASIAVFLRSPLPPFEAILLTENVHYLLVPSGNTFEVRLIALPPEFVVPATYDFFASYSLLGGEFELRSDVFAGNARVELFDALLAPYFGYLRVNSDVLSGEFPGNPLDSTTYTTGLIVRYEGLRVLGEYQERHWEASPYNRWRAEIQYVLALGVATSAFASGSYTNKHYGRGAGGSYDEPFTEETESVVASVRRELVRNMFLSVGGSYTHQNGIVDGDSYSANASWTWSVGRSEFSVGATAYGSDTEGAGAVGTEREHQRVYARIRRRLF